MRYKQIVDMAREAGAWPELSVTPEKDVEFLRRFASLIAAAEQKKWEEQTLIEINEAKIEEREACAKVCDEQAGYWENLSEHGGVVEQFVGSDKASMAEDCAAAIRARGQA